MDFVERPIEGIFSEAIPDTVCIESAYFRTRQAYQAYWSFDDEDLIALSYLAIITGCCDAHVFLCVRNPNPFKAMQIIDQGGMLADKPSLAELDHRNLITEKGTGEAQPFSVIDLADFNFTDHPNTVLNYIDSYFVVTDVNIDAVAALCERWASRITHRPGISLDSARVAEDLVSYTNLAMLRHFGGGNAYDEQIAVIGNTHLVRSRIFPCVLKAQEKVKEEWLARP